jgi:hypothetical protein
MMTHRSGRDAAGDVVVVETVVVETVAVGEGAHEEEATAATTGSKSYWSTEG